MRRRSHPFLVSLCWCGPWALACGGGGADGTDVSDDTAMTTAPETVPDDIAMTTAPETVPAGDDGAVAPEVIPDGTPLRVLFVGNSYTAVNDLPAVVERLVERSRPGVDLRHEAITPGGATLSDHYYDAATLARIGSGDFDVVVLQGQSTEPLRPAGFAVVADILAGVAREAGARVVFFATWARRAGSAYYEEQAFGGYDTPEAMAQQLDLYYSRPHAMTARVGAAFQLAVSEHPDIELYAPDGSHPSAAGTLLAAMVVAQIVGGVTPELPEPPPLAVPVDDAERLRGIVPRVACYWSFSFCAGACVSLLHEREHCGACGAACADEEPCTGGECGCPDPQATACARRCVYLTFDHAHCGACGNACAGGRRCVDGSCECPVHDKRRIAIAELSAIRPACVSGEDDYNPSCVEAAHETCAALDCFDSGFGPQSPNPANPEPEVTCVSGEVVGTSWPALAAFEATCDATTRGEPACATAIHRLCAAAGAVSGFGPVAADDEAVAVTCLEQAATVQATWADLAASFWWCNGDDVRWGPACSFATMSHCRALGYLGGFGPVEVDGDDVTLVCL